ncbi:MAG: PP2C family protein-serine/threonine phosphatase [Roseicyclus sp.]
MSLRKRVTLIVLASFLTLAVTLVTVGQRREAAVETRLEAAQLQMLAVSWSGFAATERQRLEGHFDAFRRAPDTLASLSDGDVAGLDRSAAPIRADLRRVRLQVLRPDGTLLHDTGGAPDAGPVFAPAEVAEIAARTTPVVGPHLVPGSDPEGALHYVYAAPVLATSGVAGVVVLISEIQPMLESVATTLGMPGLLMSADGRLRGVTAQLPPAIPDAVRAGAEPGGGIGYLEAEGSTFRMVTSDVPPVFGAAPLQLTVLADVTEQAARRDALATMGLAALLSATVLFVAFLNWSLASSFRPLEAIIQALAALTRGRTDITVPTPAREDEIGRLAGTFETFRQGMEARSRIGRLNQELETAASIQSQCLPRTFPEVPGLRFAADMKPMREVGGDFFDVFPLPGGRIGLVVADVSDKGMGAALFMAVARTVVRATAAASPDAATCVTRVNAYLCADNDAMLFVTLIYAVLDPETGALDLCNAGHNPPILVGPDGAARYLETDPQPALGILEGLDYVGAAAWLPEGARLFLYTDGVTEAMTAEGAEFGEARLLAALEESGGAEEMLSAVLAAVDGFLGGEPLSDDITGLAIARGAVPAALVSDAGSSGKCAERTPMAPIPAMATTEAVRVRTARPST